MLLSTINVWLCDGRLSGCRVSFCKFRHTKRSKLLADRPLHIALRASEDLRNSALRQADVLADGGLRHSAFHQLRDEFFPVHVVPPIISQILAS